jgi:hypothetical protein
VVTVPDWKKIAQDYDPDMKPEDWDLTESDFAVMAETGFKPEQLDTKEAREAYAAFLAKRSS